MIRNRYTSFTKITALSMLLVAVSCSTAAAADLVNVALGGTASQSTLGFGLPASNANDGNTGTISHTATGDLTPSLSVDLGSDFLIESLNVITRSGCCAPPERDYNLTIDILDASDSVLYTSPVFNPWDGVGAATDIGNGANFLVDLTGEVGGGVNGQKVRVSKGAFAGTEWLSIAELEIFAEGVAPPPDPNVALNKPTSGDVAFGFPTSNGNDGSIGTFNHADNTNAPPDNPFWQVDLEGTFDLERIEIVDRADGCCSPNRLEGSIITAWAADGTTLLWESDPISGLSDPSSGETTIFDNGGAGIAGVSFIRVDGFQQFFQFSELRAFENPVPEPSSVALLVMGLLGLLGYVRCRKR